MDGCISLVADKKKKRFASPGFKLQRGESMIREGTLGTTTNHKGVHIEKACLCLRCVWV